MCAMPGHGGSAQSLTLIRICGGLVLNGAAAKKHSLFDGREYKCDAKFNFHLLCQHLFNLLVFHLVEAQYEKVTFCSSVTPELRGCS